MVDNWEESGSGQPHSKTLARNPKRLDFPQGFGVRLSSAAFESLFRQYSSQRGNYLPLFPSARFSIGFDSQNFEDSLKFVITEEGDF